MTKEQIPTRADPEARETLISPEARKALDDACAAAAAAVAKIAQESARIIDAWMRTEQVQTFLHTCPKAAETDAALQKASPRVRHLALHSKKRRVQKKNISRALRAYRNEADG